MKPTLLFAWLVLGLAVTGCESSAAGPSASDGADGAGGQAQTAGGAGGSLDAANGGASGAGAPGTGGVEGADRGGAAASGVSASVGGSAGQDVGGAAGAAAGNAGAGGVGGVGGASGSGGAAGVQGSAGTGTGPTLHVFLLLGQSNMAGYPKAQDADKVEDPRIEVLGFDDCAATGRKKDTWDVAAPPLHECWNGAIGPGDYFAKTLVEELPEGDTIGLVPCAISGERIETFLKDGGTKYAWIVERAKAAQRAGGVIEGILFHQGESNNGDSSWPGKVNALITDLRADLELGEVPLLAGELAYDGPCAGHNALVNMLPTVVTHAYVVSASGLALDPADTAYHLHFGHDAQVTFGQRYAAKMIEALGW